MKYINMAKGPQNVSNIIQGCMRMMMMQETKDVEAAINAAYESGINFYDHAACYGQDGAAERIFGRAFKNTSIKREDIIIQTKCGIYKKTHEFDWRSESIMSSVDESLERLDTEYLDVLLLHRPDALFEPEDVAYAFDKLKESGKVRHFGVSNLMPMQMELLKKYVKQPIICNQVQLSVVQSQLIDQSLHINDLATDQAISRDNGTLDYCRLNDITIQAWSPLQFAFFRGTFVDNEDYPELNEVLGRIAEREGVTKAAVAIAWILRHPAKMQAVLGSTNPQHIKEVAAASDITLSHQDWYDIYLSAPGKFLP